MMRAPTLNASQIAHRLLYFMPSSSLDCAAFSMRAVVRQPMLTYSELPACA